MVCQLDHCVNNATGNGVVHDVAQGCQTDDHFMNVSAVQIFQDGGYEHDEQVGILVEEERAHEVPDSFEDERLILREVNCMNVSKGRRVPEHFNVHGANEILLEIFGCDIFFGHAGFEGL